MDHQQQQADPPFYETYKALFEDYWNSNNNNNNIEDDDSDIIAAIDVEELELPLIDLGRLNGTEDENEGCREDIARASREWGFFQVINHGISRELLEKMKVEQVKVFKQPFEKKKRSEDLKYNISVGTYRWGTPSATCLKQLSWSEAFHIPMNHINSSSPLDNTLSSTMKQFGTTVANLAQKLAEVLSEKLGNKSSFFKENCSASTCYLRMNRYPVCSIFGKIFGLMPHTDSDFLTILHQDQVGGLQLVKDGKWISVKPNPNALIINIGDLFQAWSNNIYKSVQHRVMTNPRCERFSIAYFFCPSYDTFIQNSCEFSVYKKFSFREYREQVHEDVRKFGNKVGLPRFLK